MANAHHATRKAADKDLSEGTITEQAHAAVIGGMMTLQEARNIGTDDAPTDSPEGTAVQGEGQETLRSAQNTPPQPRSRISKNDATQECWCGVCGEQTSPGRRFKPGHDQRAKGIIKRAVREGKVDELDTRLKEYGAERGLI